MYGIRRTASLRSAYRSLLSFCFTDTIIKRQKKQENKVMGEWQQRSSVLRQPEDPPGCCCSPVRDAATSTGPRYRCCSPPRCRCCSVTSLSAPASQVKSYSHLINLKLQQEFYKSNKRLPGYLLPVSTWLFIVLNIPQVIIIYYYYYIGYACVDSLNRCIWRRASRKLKFLSLSDIVIYFLVSSC